MPFNNIHNILDFKDKFKKEIELKSNEPELPITSLPTVSKKLWLEKRKLVIIGGRTGHAKSTFAMQLALDFAMAKKTVLFLSLEMENLECFEKIVTRKNDINNFEFRTNFGKRNFDKIDKMCADLKGTKFLISDCIGSTYEQVEKLMEEATKIQENPIDVVFIDYIQNTSEPEKNKLESYNSYLTKIRLLAIRHNFCAIILSQINRTSPEAKDKRPYMHQLKGTGKLEEHADKVVLLSYPRKYNIKKSLNEFWVYIAKNKHFGESDILLHYYPEFSKFEEEKITHKSYKEEDENISTENINFDNPNLREHERVDWEE